MSSIIMKICPIGSPPAFPDIKVDSFKFGEVERVAILQDGTANGHPACCLIGKDQEGKDMGLQLTSNIMAMVAGGMFGACERWEPEAWKHKIIEREQLFAFHSALKGVKMFPGMKEKIGSELFDEISKNVFALESIIGYINEEMN